MNLPSFLRSVASGIGALNTVCRLALVVPEVTQEITALHCTDVPSTRLSSNCSGFVSVSVRKASRVPLLNSQYVLAAWFLGGVGEWNPYPEFCDFSNGNCRGG